MTRLSVGLLAVVALLVTAGCVDSSLVGPSEDRLSVSTSTAEPTTVPRATYPDPPADLTNETANRAAVAYEEAHLQNQIRKESEIAYFELGHVEPVNATVLNRSDGGAYAEVDATHSTGPRK